MGVNKQAKKKPLDGGTRTKGMSKWITIRISHFAEKVKEENIWN